jgi:hypothetical protein
LGLQEIDPRGRIVVGVNTITATPKSQDGRSSRLNFAGLRCSGYNIPNKWLTLPLAIFPAMQHPQFSASCTLANGKRTVIGSNVYGGA